MSVEHTPGPWTFVGTPKLVGGEPYAADDGSALPYMIVANNREAFEQWGLVGDGSGCRVAYVACNRYALTAPVREADEIGYDAHARVRANARLLAAAPDLLAACRAVYGEEMAYGSVGALVEQAIEKATGESAKLDHIRRRP